MAWESLSRRALPVSLASIFTEPQGLGAQQRHHGGVEGEIVDDDVAAELVACGHEALHLGTALGAERLGDLETHGIRRDAVALQAGRHLLEKPFVLQGGDGEVYGKAGGLSRPRGAIGRRATPAGAASRANPGPRSRAAHVPCRSAAPRNAAMRPPERSFTNGSISRVTRVGSRDNARAEPVAAVPASLAELPVSGARRLLEQPARSPVSAPGEERRPRAGASAVGCGSISAAADCAAWARSPSLPQRLPGREDRRVGRARTPICRPPPARLAPRPLCAAARLRLDAAACARAEASGAADRALRSAARDRTSAVGVGIRLARTRRAQEHRELLHDGTRRRRHDAVHQARRRST